MSEYSEAVTAVFLLRKLGAEGEIVFHVKQGLLWKGFQNLFKDLEIIVEKETIKVSLKKRKK